MRCQRSDRRIHELGSLGPRLNFKIPLDRSRSAARRPRVAEVPRISLRLLDVGPRIRSSRWQTRPRTGSRPGRG
jgi:hypothetical protein